MAFTFKVEDGSGFTDSNSFASVEAADEYWELDIHQQYWPTLLEPVKQKLLALATRYLVQRYDFRGTRVLTDQALPYPVEGGTHPDGTPIDLDEVPDAIVTATIEWASILAKSAPRDATATHGLKRIEVDVIQLEFDTAADIVRAPDIVDQLIKWYAQQKGRKPSFKKIIRS